MVDILKRLYGLNVVTAERSSVGAGSDTYFVTCDNGKYVVKFPSVSEINNIEAEPRICEFLLDNNVSVCRFLKNTDGSYISADESGRQFHVQEFIEGTMYDWNTAPEWLLCESAKALGKIHAALKYHNGPGVGIGKDFFKYMTPENALHSYENTVRTARKNGDRQTEQELLYRIGLMKRFPKYEFDVDRLTCSCSHGDYFISQLICGEDKINAVIDWTTACIHPAVWEIMRSYVYAAPECARGAISIKRLAEYFADYLRFAPLDRYDIQTAAELFYYQISVCDYYNQYYSSTAANREIYLRQAQFSTALMKWFEENIDELTEELLRKYEDL